MCHLILKTEELCHLNVDTSFLVTIPIIAPDILSHESSVMQDCWSIIFMRAHAPFIFQHYQVEELAREKGMYQQCVNSQR